MVDSVTRSKKPVSAKAPVSNESPEPQDWVLPFWDSIMHGADRELGGLGDAGNAISELPFL